jgi:hypothetical protein
MVRRAVAVCAALLVSVAGFAGAAEGGPRGAGADGLRLIRTLRSLTGTHEWYQQTYRGYAVLGSYYGRHFDRSGRLVSVDDGRLAVHGAVAPPSVTMSGPADLVVMPGRARLVWARYSRDGVRTLVDAGTGAVVSRRSVIKEASTGKGRVFDPNPVVTLKNESLTDQKDTDYAALQPAYFTRTLTNLDGSGFLRGDYADVSGTTSRASSSTLQFLFGRSDDRFEQTMAYYDVTGAQSYIQSLGFTDVNNEPQEMKIDQYGGDNSFYSPKQDYIKLGKGGVDDAEDAEVIWHEYGHAIQDAQVPGFGSTFEASSIGEGFGDYWAATMSIPVSGGFDIPCIADWDSISYTSTVPHCLRRVDTNLTISDAKGQDPHFDGQIWSRALWDIQKALGRTTADRIILEAQFSFAPDTSFVDAALDTVAAAQALNGGSAATKVRKAFQGRGIL